MEKKYPYIGKHTFQGKEYVVFFLKENYGVVVMTNIEGNEKYSMGYLGEFDEEPFEVLPPDVCVRISN